SQGRDVVLTSPGEGVSADVDARGDAILRALDPRAAQQGGAAEILAQAERVFPEERPVGAAHEVDLVVRRLHAQLVELVLVRGRGGVARAAGPGLARDLLARRLGARGLGAGGLGADVAGAAPGDLGLAAACGCVVLRQGGSRTGGSRAGLY